MGSFQFARTQLSSENSVVRVWSYREHFLRDTGPAMAELVLSLLARAAKQEHVRISERTKAGLARVRAEGMRLGPPPTYAVDAQRARLLRRDGRPWSAPSSVNSPCLRGPSPRSGGPVERVAVTP